MCMGGLEDEKGTFRRLFNNLYPTGIVSIVSDTWDFWKVVTEYLPEFKDEIMARQPDALGLNKVVIRPDSGDPVKIICGYNFQGDAYEDKEHAYSDLDCETSTPEVIKITEEFYLVHSNIDGRVGLESITEHEVKGAIECLWDTFGGTETEEGYKLLDEHIGLIYGDSITLDRAQEIVDRLKAKGFASTNVVFGIGSYTYQYNTRDTFGFAMKATYGEVEGVGREIFKDPKTDGGTKKSARGLLRVDKVDGEYALTDQVASLRDTIGDELQTVFLNGKSGNLQTFSEIKDRLNGEL